MEDHTAHEDPPPRHRRTYRCHPMAFEPAASETSGLLSPPVPSGAKTLWSQRALEKMGRCACTSRDPASGPWEHLDPGVQQLLEEKEQALAVLQETVKILQMKVVRLECLVKLKDQWIGELMRPRDKPQ